MPARTGTATLTEWDLDNRRKAGRADAIAVTVDFDPQSLELSYTASGQTGGQEKTPAGTFNKAPAQQTGQTASLSVTLLFDTSEESNRSVQEKTDPLVLLTLPHDLTGDKRTRRVVRFEFGSFAFTGCVDQMTQTIDMFSDGGTPLRASAHLTLSQVGSPAPEASPPRSGAGSFGAGSIGAGLSGGVGIGGGLGVGVAGVGTTALTLSQSGDTLQAIAARAGVSWQALASANGIDNPRVLPPGTVLDLGRSDGR